MYLFAFLLLPLGVAQQLIYHTMDDTLGDELTGLQVNYSLAGQHSSESALVGRTLCKVYERLHFKDGRVAL